MPCVAGRQAYSANSVMQGGTTEDYYRMNVAVPFIDPLLQELLTRFEPENRVGKDLFTLVPAAIIKENNLSDLASRLQFWEIDMPSSSSSLLSELKLWKKFWEQYHGRLRKCAYLSIANCLIEADRDVYLRS